MNTLSCARLKSEMEMEPWCLEDDGIFGCLRAVDILLDDEHIFERTVVIFICGRMCDSDSATELCNL